MGDVPGDWTHRISAGPWPERVGLRCRIIPAPRNAGYPWHGCPDHEAVVLVENDPYANGVYSFGPGMTDAERGWTCVIDRGSLYELPEAPCTS